MPTSADLLLDTSAAVPLVVASDTAHAAIVTRTSGLTLGMAGHAAIELYSVLTRLPGAARLSAAAAARVLAVDFPAGHALSPEASRQAPAAFAAVGIAGGACYDGLVGLAARQAGVTLLTRDVRAVRTYSLLDVDYELV